MSEIKVSLLDKRLAQFAESTTNLLTDIHARNKGESNKGGNKGTPIRKKRMKKTISKPSPDIDALDKEPSGL